MVTNETETLTPGFIKKCKKRLLKEKREIDDWLAVGPPEPADYEEYEIRQVLKKYLSEKDQKERRLRAVIDALDRIEKGTFGRCLGCPEMILKERLETDPTRERCSRCQSKHSPSPTKALPHWPKKKKKSRHENLYFS